MLDDCRLLELLTDLEARIARGENVYVHCWGGRGRAGLVAACFLQHAYGISGEEALQRIGRAYDTRGDTGVFAALCCQGPHATYQLVAHELAIQLRNPQCCHVVPATELWYRAGYRSPETEQQRQLVRDFGTSTRS